MSQPPHEALERLRAIEHDMLGEVIAHVRKTYSSYRSVSDELLAVSFAQNLQMSIEGVASHSLPTDEIMRRHAQIARTRFDLDIPAEDIVASMRFSIGLIGDTLDRLMVEEGVEAEERLAAYRRLWDVSDTYTGVLVQVYRQHRLRAETRDHAVKLGLLARLRTGETDDLMVQAMRERLGLHADRRYRAFIAEPCGGRDTDLYGALARMDGRLADGHGFAVIQGDAVFGASDTLLSGGPDLSVCFGSEAGLTELHGSFADADKVHKTSLRGRPGTHTFEEAGWRTLVADAPAVLGEYRRRFEEPLRDAVADSDSILRTVEVLLEADRSYPEAARRLHCHLNTVRYRIRKFEDVTDCSLESVEDIIAVSWFLEGRRTSGAES